MFLPHQHFVLPFFLFHKKCRNIPKFKSEKEFGCGSFRTTLKTWLLTHDNHDPFRQ
jgi:hypothetical protein